MGLFSKLKEGLTKTRNNIVSGIDSIFSGFSSIDDDFYEELEETLIMGDIGVRAADEIRKTGLKTQRTASSCLLILYVRRWILDLMRMILRTRSQSLCLSV